MSDGAKLQLRLSQDLKGWLRDEAARNDRSMNNQVVAVLREKMKESSQVQKLQDAHAVTGAQ